MKRVLSLVLALVLVLGMIPTFAADMTGAENLQANDFIAGNAEGDLLVDAMLTREQLAALITELKGENDEAAVFAFPADYADAAKISTWARPYVSYVKESGWMTGKPGNMFDPKGAVSAQQLAVVLLNALGYEFTWDTALDVAMENGIEFDNEGDLTRGDAFEAMWVAVNTVVNGSELTLGQELGKIEIPAPTVALDGVALSAINSTTFNLTATFVASEDLTEANMLEKAITLTNGSVVVKADFVSGSIAGNTAKFRVTNFAALTTGSYAANGSFVPKADWATFQTGVVATYSEIITGTFIKGFVLTGTTAVADVKVTVGTETVMTDANGFYSIASNPGNKTIMFEKTGYFLGKSTIDVARNFTSVRNFNLTTYDAEKLVARLTVTDSVTGLAVPGATVKLEKKNDSGTFEPVAKASAVTNASGIVQFKNLNAAVEPDADINLDLDSANYLVAGKDYRFSVYKKTLDTDLENVYEVQYVSFSINNTSEITDVSTSVVKVAKVKSFGLKLKWAAGVIPDVDNITFALVDTDGKTVIETDAAIDVIQQNNAMTDAKNMIDYDYFVNANNTDNTPRIPTGKYFAIINDGTNALTVVPVNVTAGNDVLVEATIGQAKVASVVNTLTNITYAGSLLIDPSTPTDVANVAITTDDEAGLALVAYDPLDTLFYLGNAAATNITVIQPDLTRDLGTTVDVAYDVFKTVEGVDVDLTSYVTINAGTMQVDLSGPAATLAAGTYKTPVQQLTGVAAGDYKLVYSGNLLRGASFVTATAGDALANTTASFKSAGSLDMTLENTTPAPVTAGTLNSVKLYKVENNVSSLVKEIKATAFVSPATATVKTLSQVMADEFTNIQPGQYKLEIDLAGYKVKVTDPFFVFDFQEQVIAVTGLTPLPVTNLQGYIRFAHNNANVDNAGNAAVDASVSIYNASGQFVAGADLADMATGYTVNLNALTVGTAYKAIVRGNGFEVQAKDFTLVAGDNTLNFLVAQGGKGKADIKAQDTNFNSLAGAAHTGMYVTDAWFQTGDKNGDGDVIDAGEVAATTVTFAGKYDMTSAGSKVYESTDTGVELLSVGNYVLVIPEGTNTKATTKEFRITDVNETYYTEILVPLLSSAVGQNTVAINVVLTEGFDKNAVNYVEAVNAAGVVVARAKAAANLDATATAVLNVPVDSQYTIRVYADGTIYDDSTVSVQQRNVTVTIGLDAAHR